MKPHDKESLIERYMRGELKGADQQEFLRLLALDSELRRILDAEQTIDRAMKKDLGALPVDHSKTRARALATLAATGLGAAGLATEVSAAMTSETSMTGTASAVASGTVTSGALSGGFLGGLGALKGTILAVAAAGAITGSLFFSGVLDKPVQQPPAAVTPAPTMQSPSQTTGTVAPQTESIGNDRTATSAVEQSSPLPSATTGAPQERREPSRATRTAVKRPATQPATTQMERQPPVDNPGKPPVYEQQHTKPSLVVDPPNNSTSPKQ